MRRISVVGATLVGVVAVIILIERQPYLPSARFFETLLVVGLLAVAAWAVHGRTRDALVTLCSLLFGIAVLEGSVLSAGAGPQPVGNDGGNGGGRPLLGWGAVRPGVFHSTKTGIDGQMIFDTHVTIDQTLNRKTVPSNGPRPIAFFGDSWVYGDGVDDKDTLPQAFADLNKGRIPVLNLAFGGWSPAQNLVALQTGLYDDLLKEPRHFILFTSSFHVERTSCKASYVATAPRYVMDGKALRYVGMCTGSATTLLKPVIRVVRRFALYERIAPLFARLNDRDVETYIRLIEAFVSTAKDRYGVKTTVLFAPFGDQYIKDTGRTEGDILGALRRDGIDVLVDELPKIDNPKLYRIAVDGHPTALANRARAEEVEAHLRTVDPAALDTGPGGAAAH